MSMREWIGRLWRARGDRNEELATVRGMLKLSEARNLHLLERMAEMEKHLAAIDRLLYEAVIVRRV